MNPLKLLDRFVLAGISASVVLSLVLYIVGVDTVSSLIVGLLGTVLTMQVDLMGKTERAIARKDANTDLIGRIEQASGFQELLFEIIEYAFRVSNRISDEWFRQRAVLEMERLKDFLQALSKGTLQTGPIDNDALILLMNQAKKQLVVTSPTSTDEDWWLSPRGRKFWQANIDAVQRGVGVTRIFLFEESTGNIQEVMQEQLLSGVNVYGVRYADLPVDLRVSLVRQWHIMVVRLRYMSLSDVSVGSCVSECG